MMCVCKVLFLLWILSLLSRNGFGYNYEDFSDFSYNDLTDGDQQEPASPCPGDNGGQLHWDKIFIMMEDSYMRQTILLQANEELKMEMSSLRKHIQKLSYDIATSCLRVVEETCRSVNTQQNLRVDQNIIRLKRDAQQSISMKQLEEMKKREKMKELKNMEEMREMDKKVRRWKRITNSGDGQNGDFGE